MIIWKCRCLWFSWIWVWSTILKASMFWNGVSNQPVCCSFSLKVQNLLNESYSLVSVKNFRERNSELKLFKFCLVLPMDFNQIKFNTWNKSQTNRTHFHLHRRNKTWSLIIMERRTFKKAFPSNWCHYHWISSLLILIKLKSGRTKISFLCLFF